MRYMSLTWGYGREARAKSRSEERRPWGRDGLAFIKDQATRMIEIINQRKSQC